MEQVTRVPEERSAAQDTARQSPPGVRPAVTARALRRVYPTRQGAVVALAGVDLEVRPGELYGVLGPNGAGKTTLIKILVTLLLPSAGSASVDGLDVVTQARALRRRIAMVSGGEQSGYGMLTMREQLWMFAQLHGLPGSVAYPRIDAALQRLNMTTYARRRVSALSSGMRQKMNLVRGLVTNPTVLFLDEPTVALDVEAAREVRGEVKRWMAEDPTRTVILTTHYMQEADELCDRIAIVSRGSIVAEGTPAQLKRRAGGEVTVDVELSGGEGVVEVVRSLPGVGSVTLEPRQEIDRLSVVLEHDAALTRVLVSVEEAGARVQSLTKREPTLEDAFVKLVGRSMAEDER